MVTLLVVWSVVSVAIAGVILANVRIRITKTVTKKPISVPKKVSTHKRINVKV